jgi:hypothetical protein
MTDFFIIFLEVVIGLLSAYLIYYAQQKGKNQADKEDLKRITTTVEEVKQKYVEENELLRANLNLLTSKKNILFTEEKEAIVQYFSALNRWLWDGLNFRISEYNHTNIEALNRKHDLILECINQMNFTFSKLQLLIKDEELIKIAHDTFLETLKYDHIIEELVLRLRDNLQIEKKNIDQKTSDEKKEIINEYYTNYKDRLNPILEERGKFIIRAKEYLNK